MSYQNNKEIIMKNNTILVYNSYGQELSYEEINIDLFKSFKIDDYVNGCLTEQFFSYLLQDQFGISGERKVYNKDNFAIEFDDRTSENEPFSSGCIPFQVSFFLIPYKQSFFKRLFRAFKN